MTTVTMASTKEDVQALETMALQHAELVAGLDMRVRAVLSAANRSDEPRLFQARDDLVAWCRRELELRAGAEESTLYAAGLANPRLEPLTRAMSHEHGLTTTLIARVATTTDPAELAAAVGALRSVAEAHVAKENEFLLPALATEPQVSLADLFEQMQAHVAAHAGADSTAAADLDDRTADNGGHTCGCNEHDGQEPPELDARAVPHAIRHATIHGALDAVTPGGAMVLVAPHDPLPLLAEIDRRAPGAFEVSYLERGPQAWRLEFTRSTG